MKKIFMLLALLSLWAWGEVKVGESIKLTLPDQFDTQHTINSKAYKKIVVTFEKDISQKINIYLQDQEKELLKTKKIAYISDIHKMPSLVTSMFAIRSRKISKLRRMTFLLEKIAGPWPLILGMILSSSSSNSFWCR